MKLRMNMCDVDLRFEVFNYNESTGDAAKYDWCNTNFSLKSKYIDYGIEGSELFLNNEVDHLKSAFKNLLEGNIKEKCTVIFLEPDFEFVMSPITTLYSEPGKVLYENGSKTFDIFVDFKIHFWCDEGGLGSNVFSMTLDREKIHIFYTYLQMVTGEIDKESDLVSEYIKKGYFYTN